MAIGRMALGATRRRASIQTNRFSIFFDFVLVTLPAGDFVVRAIEREVGLVVIENRRPPAFQIVAVGALFFLAGVHELAAVNILMTSGTF